LPGTPLQPGLIRRAPRAARTGAVAALAIALASCGSGSDDAAAPSTAADSGPLTAPELVRKVEPSTVSIVSQPPGEGRAPTKHGRHAHGSGVIWDAARGLVLTSDHLVENAGSIEVLVNGDTTVHARLVARAQCNDLALLALHPRPSGLKAIERGNSTQLQLGEKVTALGYLKPASATKASLIRTSGEVSSVDISTSVSPDLPDFPSVVLHQAPLQSQMSGGPLVNDKGELIGVSIMVPGAATSGAFAAVSSNYLAKRMTELKPGPGSLFVGWKGEHACHGQMVKIANRVLVSHGAPTQHAEHGGR
jgi:serine protease Do